MIMLSVTEFTIQAQVKKQIFLILTINVKVCFSSLEMGAVLTERRIR